MDGHSGGSGVVLDRARLGRVEEVWEPDICSQ